MSADVFEEAPARVDFVDESCDPRPEMSRVVDSLSFSGLGERLAWVSANDAIHEASPLLAMKGMKIRPNRRWIQGFLFHARSQDVCSERFVLNAADDASSRDRHSDADVKHPGAGADRQDPRGT